MVTKVVFLLLFNIFFAELVSARDRNYVFPHPDCPSENAFSLGISSNSRIPDSNMWSSTSIRSTRGAHYGRLMVDRGAWTPSRQDTFQYLAIDLNNRYIITKVQTQGRLGSDEFVTEFGLEFSDDNSTWNVLTNEFGIPHMFRGNKDGNSVVDHTLRYPAIARYIKFIPQRWNDLISLRVEAIGCPYVAHVAMFSGTGSISFDISEQAPIQGYEDMLMIRFKTNRPSGMLFYADGNQGDYLAIEMKQGFLHMNIDLGSTPSIRGNTTSVGGSLLDDGQWHDMIMRRNKNRIIFTVDRLETEFITNGVFERLDLDKHIYLAGVPTLNMNGITVQYNFTGCVENPVFNHLKIIRDMKQNQPRFSKSGPVQFACGLRAVPPLTFPSFDSRMKVIRDVGRTVAINVHFRTYDEEVLIARVPLSDGDNSFVTLNLNTKGYIEYIVSSVTSKGVQVTVKDTVQNNDLNALHSGFSDGLWHKLSFEARENQINCTVDNNNKVSRRDIVISSTGEYSIGGSEIDMGFRGCMHTVLLNYKEIDITSELLLNGAQFGTCSILDRCTPLPCEHGGKCTQNWDNFYCNCTGTGYTGEICRTSSYPLSCVHHKFYSIETSDEVIKIDVDGSGVMEPFEVTCKYKNEGTVESVETFIQHDSMNPVTVDGFDEPGSYHRKINYITNLLELTEVIERSVYCKQRIKYECINARLLTPTNDPNGWPHYGWWVGRTYQPMYYWGGASPGSGKCSCGLTENGCEGGNLLCNCDSITDFWSQDDGYLEHKEYLPVLELRLGDTGTSIDNKKGRHTVGELICEGDNMFDNVVTFRKADATIKLPTFEAENSGDIWFQFKTSARDGIFLQNRESNVAESLDFIEIRLVNGDSVQFRFNVGNGLQVLEFQSPSALNNDDWHTVHVERNRKQAWLKVDTYPPKFIYEAQDETTRMLDLTSELFVGASLDFRDGYVGCMRALRVNGFLKDLRGIVERGDATYGVQAGCVGKCASSPCFNGGTCIEKYSSYTCDCAYTPFRGWMCGREVGANMQVHFIIKYTFDEFQGFTATDFQYARIGFSTKKKQGILMQISDEKTTEYINIEINNAGGIKVFFDVGDSDRYEINTPSTYPDLTNGQQHEAVIRILSISGPRSHIEIQVDNYPKHIDELPGASTSDSILNNPKYIYIGNNDTDTPNRGFEGCIFRMQVDNIYPLKRAFQEPRPSYLSLEPEGEIMEDMCGSEERTQPPDLIETRPGDGIYVNVTYPIMPDVPLTEEEKLIIGLVVTLFILIMIIVILCIVKYVFKKGGDYETEEAKGAELADNPDTAVVYNQTGAVDISKRREWFM